MRVCGVAGVLALLLVACGDRTGLEVEVADGSLQPDVRMGQLDASREADTSVVDASVMDVAVVDGGACSTVVVGDIFGGIVYFGGGTPFPPGRYRVSYVDGCMKYAAAWGWSVHADGQYAWSLVGDTSADKIVRPPGTVGYMLGSGGFTTFDECVTANQVLAPVDFRFAGGRIGLWLYDEPYGDNVGGPGGRSPSWRLECMGP